MSVGVPTSAATPVPQSIACVRVASIDTSLSADAPEPTLTSYVILGFCRMHVTSATTVTDSPTAIPESLGSSRLVTVAFLTFSSRC
ncbi:MAG: hypothetical protein J07HR59_01218 [Halorubrum sp. J07HR59]|nr:MAG: hypothetical protein J07HR59_01218 [Halorubrum sp. J07HR59]